MKNDDVESLLGNLEVPDPGDLKHRQELKIPLLSFKRSSRAGLWLLVLPLIFFVTRFLRYEVGIPSPVLDVVYGAFKAASDNPVLTLLIPLIFVGLPVFALIMNVLAFCHFRTDGATREILVTIKYRPLNMAISLVSFAVLVYVLLPDALP